MGQHNKYGRGGVPAPPTPLPKGTILNASGGIERVLGEFAFSEESPRPDETVYWIYEAFVGPQVLGLKPTIGKGFIFCTFRLPNGTPEDVGCIILRGSVPPPEGTRFAMRMLRPEEERQHATQNPENQGRQEAQNPQGDARVQDGELKVVVRQEGDEPQAGDSDSPVGERPEQKEAEKETLGAALAHNPEARALLEQGRAYVDGEGFTGEL